jgi:hypothetical protein
VLEDASGDAGVFCFSNSSHYGALPCLHYVGNSHYIGRVADVC